MRIFLIILLVLATLLGLVCLSAVSVGLRYWGGRFEWCVRYCGIKLLPRPKKAGGIKKRHKRRKKNSKPEAGTKQAASESANAPPDEAEMPEQESLENEEATEDTITEKSEKKPFQMDERWKRLMDLANKADIVDSGIYAFAEPLKQLVGGITWYAIETDFLIGGEDAFRCAQLYGSINGILELLLGLSGHFIQVKRKKIAVVCDFTADTCRWNFSCRFKIRVGTMMRFGVRLVWRYFTDRHKTKKQFKGKKI